MAKYFTWEGLRFTSSYCARELAMVAVAALLLHLLMPGRGRLSLTATLRRPQLAHNLFYTFANAVVFAPIWLGPMLWLTHGFKENYLVEGRALITSWPYWVQFLAASYVADLVSYWRHRAFHGRLLWNIHAAHHSAPDLYWLVNGRTHPLNAFASSLLFTLVPYCMGFDLAVSSLAVLTRKYWAYFIHSNMVSWDFGPLRHILVSPRFHAWHHSRQAEALDKNYSGVFAFHDWLFGTYYLPRERLPEDFGVQDPSYPQSLWGQLAYPFTRAPAVSASGD